MLQVECLCRYSVKAQPIVLLRRRLYSLMPSFIRLGVISVLPVLKGSMDYWGSWDWLPQCMVDRWEEEEGVIRSRFNIGIVSFDLFHMLGEVKKWFPYIELPRAYLYLMCHYVGMSVHRLLDWEMRKLSKEEEETFDQIWEDEWIYMQRHHCIQMQRPIVCIIYPYLYHCNKMLMAVGERAQDYWKLMSGIRKK